MAVFTAIAATFNYLVYTGIVLIGGGGAAALFAIQAGAALITGALVYGVGRGVGKALMPDIPSGNVGANGGTRVQLSPSPSYSVPVVYGHAFQNGIITDAAISTDNQTMTYVITLGEKTGGTTTLGDIFWNDKKLVFASSTSAEVVSTIDEDGTTSTDYANNVEVYVWDDTTELRGDGSAPHTLVSHWDSSDRNSGTIFAIVKVTFDPEAQLTGLGTITAEMTNSLINPADVLDDYLLNTTYGCGIPVADLDTTTLQTLRTYSNQQIDYTNKDGVASTQARYTMNGIVNTSEDCRTVIDRLLTACNSFFAFNAKSGKWKITPNRAESTASAFTFDDDNILGELKFSTTALDGAYNSIEIEYPDRDQKDKNNYTTIDLPSNLRETNEPDNQMALRMEFVNNNVQAEYLANQQLRQTRDDLVVMFTADYSALQVDAGDIIKLYETQIYGQNNKLYRVLKCVEKETDDGMITVDITAIEYNADVYTVEPITEFTPSPNSDISLFNRLGQASTPTVDNERSLLSLPVFDVNTNTPAAGIYDRAELHFADNSSFNNSQLLLTKSTPSTFGNGVEVEFTVRGLPTGTYYYKTRVGNEQGYGAYSTISSAHTWTANVQINPVTIIDPSDPVFTVTGLNIKMIPQSISNSFLSAGVVSALGRTVTIPEVAGYFYFTASGNTTAPTTSAFNTQVGRDPIDNDVVIVTNTTNDEQTGYIHNGTSFVAQTNFFAGGLITDGTLGANKIVANSIDTAQLAFTPITEIAGVTGGTITSAQLNANGLELTSSSIATSRLAGTVDPANGGTGETSITNLTATLAADGLRLSADTVNTNLLTGGAIPQSLGGTGTTSRTAMYTADGVRLDSQTVPFSSVTGSVPESQGGTGSTTLSAALSAEGVRFTSQTIPFGSITGTVPQNQGGTGSTSFASALTAQGVGFVSGSNANLGALATLNNINLSQVTDSGTLAGLNNAVLGTNTSGTLPEGQGGTGQTSDSAYASHLSSQGLIVTEVAGSTGAVSAATIISAGSIAVIGQDISDFTNDTGFIPGSAVNTNVTSISGGVITTGTINSNRINTDTLNVKHFADVSTDIISHTGSAVPLSSFSSAFQRASTSFNVQTQSTGTYLSHATSDVRNGATYNVIWTGVYGDCTNGVLEYSVNGGSSYVQAAGGIQNVTMSAGTFRTYVFSYNGTISGLPTSGTNANNVYWRVRWLTKLRSTYQSMYVTIDNTH